MAGKVKKDQEIREAMKSENNLRPAQKAASKKHREWTLKMQKLLDHGTEDQLVELLSEAGVAPDSDAGKRALQFFRENRRS